MDEAERQLRENRQQLDWAGIMVVVSRRALDETLDRLARAEAQFSAERERVERLRTSHASILAQRPDREICYEIARKALADTRE